jgi:hypothetical protein
MSEALYGLAAAVAFQACSAGVLWIVARAERGLPKDQVAAPSARAARPIAERASTPREIPRAA